MQSHKKIIEPKYHHLMLHCLNEINHRPTQIRLNQSFAANGQMMNQDDKKYTRKAESW